MAHILNLDDGDPGEVYPAVMGSLAPDSRVETLVNETDWTVYRRLEAQYRWNALSCQVQVGDLIWHVGSSVYRLDTTDWRYVEMAPVPENLAMPGNCVYLERGGKPGILTRYSYWMDLATFEWTMVSDVKDFHHIAPHPTSLYNFRGKPTFFGVPTCPVTADNDIICGYENVVAYDVAADKWETIGKMSTSRRYQVVIEVPVDMCQYFSSSTVDPPTTSTASAGTTPSTTG